MAGAVIQWLRDGLGIIDSAADVEALAGEVDDNGDVYLVPAFVDLGAPHWDPYARGTITGLTRGSNRAHIARAALESIAYQTVDIIRAMEADSGISLTELRVDGGATANKLLMQFQAGILGVTTLRPTIAETTALGTAYLAGLAVGVWDSIEEIAELWQIDQRYSPEMTDATSETLMSSWHKALERAKGWAR
jgi:glycerol kinase